ncbi:MULTISPECIES: MarR family winged helix-turn-helix transcriptional regulator [Oceanospirillaceae]|uniref:MarR family transcriptional regulator n=1 Tax=Oceanobacter antarcticus TaxID=3133425 RepID=A0ABW8NMH9_9GAMM|tara:strand:+ start:137 stop:607 length:471 start_codon:yes stop_codon:yes gene_type:complete
MATSDLSSDSLDFGILHDLIGYRLRRTQLVFFNRFAEACTDLGISPGLFGVLVLVSRNPGRTQTAIAQALGNDRSAMVAAVDKLEKMDLVERRPSLNDRRSYALYLTEHGETFYQTIENRVREHEQGLESLLEPGEKDLLIDMLARLCQAGRNGGV